MASILIIEDEKNLAEGLKFNLELEGYDVDHFDNAEAAVDIFSNYDILILDIMLPGMNGIELLKIIREQDNKFSVLILSARGSEENMLEGLSAGADDYITKPFSLPQLILRVKRILERQQWYKRVINKESAYSFGKYWIDFDSFKAETNGGKVLLTQYECFVMKYLIENKDRSITREELLEKVWGYSVMPETRTVDIFIGRLRKMFEEDRKVPRHIVSIRSVGYQFHD